jgi:hypothetical protein
VRPILMPSTIEGLDCLILPHTQNCHHVQVCRLTRITRDSMGLTLPPQTVALRSWTAYRRRSEKAPLKTMLTDEPHAFFKEDLR